jgi:hypothetical protein
LSTSAEFGTSDQPSLFFALGFQPSRERANGAVTFGQATARLAW